MATPISALQRNAARIVRKIAASGVAEEITDRRRVVAILSPPATAHGLDRLREVGATRPADPTALREVLALLPDLPALGLAAALAEQRDSDR